MFMMGKWYAGFIVKRQPTGWTARFPDAYGFFGVGAGRRTQAAISSRVLGR